MTTPDPETADTLHVSPTDDLIEHDMATDQPDCVCGPRVEVVERPGQPDGYLIVHNSLDGREQAPGARDEENTDG
jgi:hypothetical protein